MVETSRSPSANQARSSQILVRVEENLQAESQPAACLKENALFAILHGCNLFKIMVGDVSVAVMSTE